MKENYFSFLNEPQDSRKKRTLINNQQTKHNIAFWRMHN